MANLVVVGVSHRGGCAMEREKLFSSTRRPAIVLRDSDVNVHPQLEMLVRWGNELHQRTTCCSLRTETPEPQESRIGKCIKKFLLDTKK